MKKLFYIALTLFSVACTAKKEHVFYDEAKLKDFVLNPSGQLDPILADAAEDSTVFCKTITFLEKQFGDPNSPHRNEDLYIKLAGAKIKSAWTDSITKVKARERLYLLMQNRPGSVANDFTFITTAGHKKNMFDIQASYTLLFFYNPECNACKEMKSALISSAVINDKVSNGDLKILAVYTDRDESVWLDHLPELPKQWIHGRDDNEYLYKNNVYDLRAIPTVYLLDRDKKVLLKDCMDIALIEKEIYD